MGARRRHHVAAIGRTSRDLDVLLVGATGFTGKLVASYLARRTPHVRVGLAGRSLDKLKHAAEEASSSSSSWDPPLLQYPIDDREALLALASRARVVLSTAGPYSICGTPLVSACVASGTDYVDINGEVPWVREMIHSFDAAAMENGTILVPNCGCAHKFGCATAHAHRCTIAGMKVVSDDLKNSFTGRTHAVRSP